MYLLCTYATHTHITHRCADLYERGRTPLVSDELYDSLFNELQELELKLARTHPHTQTSHTSPTQHVGAKVN